MLAVGEAAKAETLRQLRDLGANTILVRSVKPMDDRDSRRNDDYLTYGLTNADLRRIQTTIPTIVSAVPMRDYRKDLRFMNRKIEGRVVGVTPDFHRQNSLRLERGRFLTEVDDSRIANVCVLGATTAETLFPYEDPVGKSVRVGETQFFRVVGVTESRAVSSGAGAAGATQDFNRDIYIPFTTDRARFGRLIINFKAGSFQAERLEISQITVLVDRTENVRQTARIIESMLEPMHPQKDVSLFVPLDLLEKAEQTQRLFTLVLGAIASISLLVGGIGIMNIMLATVTERTREIGVRRALGAKRRDVAAQFLVEAVALCGLGGLFGIGLGIGFSYAVTYFFSLPTIIRPWSPVIAFGVSIIVGLVFGTYPARRAARMDPIEALRHE
jgi:putative ABC transport system permease protein